MKDEESNNLNESNGSSTQAPKKLPYRPPYVVIILSNSGTHGKKTIELESIDPTSRAPS